MREYAKIANKDIEDTITSEMSGDLKEGFLAVGECVCGGGCVRRSQGVSE